jgi:hypothetical protein
MESAAAMPISTHQPVTLNVVLQNNLRDHSFGQ